MNSPLEENVVSFSANLVFGSSPDTFSAIQEGLTFVACPAITRYTAKTFGASGAKTPFASCEYLSPVMMASLKCAPAVADGGLFSSAAESPEPRSAAAIATRAILFIIPPSPLGEVLPGPFRNRTPERPYLIVVPRAARVSDEPAWRKAAGRRRDPTGEDSLSAWELIS